MADGRERAEWSRMSALLALIANVNRDPNKFDPFTPADFDPYAERARVKLSPAESADFAARLLLRHTTGASNATQ